MYRIGTILSVNWCHITDLVSANGKTKEVYCCDIIVLIVLFSCFWCVKDYNVVSVYWNIVWWGCETISISWLLFSPLLKPGQLSGCDVSWLRESLCLLWASFVSKSNIFSQDVKQTRNKSNDYFESMQYRQDVRHIAPYHKRKHFPSCTCCSENHNNMCAGNRKIRGLKFQYSVLAPSGGV